MKRLAGRQTRYRNRLERRSGTLWESRYKSSPVQTDTYLLACKRYIDLNPVRARMVGDPGEYRWSSYRRHARGEAPAWLDDDPCYLAFGRSRAERGVAYARFVREGIPRGEWELIREALQRGQLIPECSVCGEVESIPVNAWSVGDNCLEIGTGQGECHNGIGRRICDGFAWAAKN